MTPQRRNAVLFFIFMLLLSGGIVMWHFFLNRGFAEISGPSPFSVSVGVFEKYECPVSPCRISLRPKNYRVVARKDGYFDSGKEMAVKLFRTEKISLEFQLKPVVLEADKVPDRIDRSKLPKGASRILFSPSGTKAIVWLGKEQYLYEYDDGKREALLSKILLPRHETLAWKGENEFILLASPGFFETEENAEWLMAVSLEELKQNKVTGFSVITSFKRPLENPAIVSDPEAQKVFLRESSGQTYLVDVKTKQKSRVDIPKNIKDIRFLSSEIVIFSNSEGEIRALRFSEFLNGHSTAGKILTALNFSALTPLYNEQVFFISYEPAISDNIGVPLEDVFEMAKKNLGKIRENPEETGKRWYIISYHIPTGKFTTVAEIPREETEKFLSFDQNFAKNGIFFETQKGKEKRRFFLKVAE